VCARRRRVVLTDVALIVPRSPCNEFACGEIEIPLESISGVSVCDFGGSSQLLVIEHQSGKITLPSCMFPRGRQFAELAWVLTEACNNREPDEETASP